MRLVVLSAFPGSGRDWVQTVLATALTGERPTPLALDRMLVDAHKPLGDPAAWLTDPALILRSSFLPSRLRRYLECFARSAPAGCDLDGLRVVHIVRDPLDMAVAAHGALGPSAGAFEAFFEALVDPCAERPAAFVAGGFGNWRQNSQEWLGASQTGAPPVRIVRYEDLTARPVEAFGEMFDWIGVKPSLPIADCLDLCPEGDRAGWTPGMNGAVARPGLAALLTALGYGNDGVRHAA